MNKNCFSCNGEIFNIVYDGDGKDFVKCLSCGAEEYLENL